MSMTQKQWNCQSQQARLLFEATKTGKYPPGTTAQTLAACKDPHDSTALHKAAFHGHLPAGTTIEDLKSCQDAKGRTALHESISGGHLPQGIQVRDLVESVNYNGWSVLHEAVGGDDRLHHFPLDHAPAGAYPCPQGAIPLSTLQRQLGITVHDLATCKDEVGTSALHIAAMYCHPLNATVADLANCQDNQGHSALHLAARHNHLPPGTTAKELAACCDQVGFTALHMAAAEGRLPADTTREMLEQCCDQSGVSAWDFVVERCDYQPDQVVEHLRPDLFIQHAEVAAHAACKVSITNLELKNKAIIWLGVVFALQKYSDLDWRAVWKA